jgi:hypothetical protein
VTYAEFQARWERGAGAEYDAFMRRSAAELVADARAGRHGEYYQLWRAIAAQTTLPQSGLVLLDVLRRDFTYLVRYHAAAALLALLGTTEFDPVDLTAGRPGEAAALDALERLLQERLNSESNVHPG